MEDLLVTIRGDKGADSIVKDVLDASSRDGWYLGLLNSASVRKVVLSVRALHWPDTALFSGFKMIFLALLFLFVPSPRSRVNAYSGVLVVTCWEGLLGGRVECKGCMSGFLQSLAWDLLWTCSWYFQSLFRLNALPQNFNKKKRVRDVYVWGHM
jgi:hypothetical protein